MYNEIWRERARGEQKMRVRKRNRERDRYTEITPPPPALLPREKGVGSKTGKINHDQMCLWKAFQ